MEIRHRRRIILSLMLVMAVLSPISWAVPGDDPYVEQARGHILYFPTLNHANTAVETQAPSGIIPTSPGSKIATAEDTAGKMLELAAAYRYTGNETYRRALERLYLALDRTKAKYGFYPELFGLDGTAYSVEAGDSVLQDAVFLSRAILGEEELTDNVSATREVRVQGYVEKRCEGCEQERRESSCPYDAYTSEGKERLVLVCSNRSWTTVEVEYSVPLSKFSGKLTTDDITVLHVYYNGKEIEVEGGALKGIKLKLLRHAKADILRAIAEKYLRDRKIAWGFSSLNVEEVLSSVRAKLGFQARMLLFGEESPPWDIVRYGRESRANDYIKLTKEYSLLKGAAYVPGLISSNSTASYEFAAKEELRFAASEDFEFSGRRAVYRHRGDKPRYEGVTIEYRPVRERRIHVAGSFDSLLLSKFGPEARVLGFVDVKKLPSGEYNLTVLREKIVEGEELEGKLDIRKPKYRNSVVVQYATLDLLESERLFREAIQEQNPEKFYLASDNLQIHSPWGNARQAMVALLSLDYREAEKLADRLEDDPEITRQQVLGVFEKFREWYAEKTLSRATKAVYESLQKDEHSPELERVLMYLSLEAERTELPTSEKLEDLYLGYKSYFSQGRSYESLKRMARHIPEYSNVVEAIEQRDFAGAMELIEALPAGKPREVFFKTIADEESRLSALRARVIEAVKSGNYSLAAKLASEYSKLAEKFNTSDPEVSIIGGVAEGVVKGKLSVEDAKRLLSYLEAFSEWRKKEKSEPAFPSQREEEHPEEKSIQPTAKKQKRSPLLFVLVPLLIIAAVVVTLKVKRRQRGGRR